MYGSAYFRLVRVDRRRVLRPDLVFRGFLTRRLLTFFVRCLLLVPRARRATRERLLPPHVPSFFILLRSGMISFMAGTFLCPFIISGIGDFLYGSRRISRFAFCASAMLANIGEADRSPMVNCLGGLSPVTGEVLPVQLTISKSSPEGEGLLLLLIIYYTQIILFISSSSSSSSSSFPFSSSSFSSSSSSSYRP